MSKHAWMMACAVGALGFGSGGAAQAATATSDAANASASAVAEITVTAQKREENLEKVPVAVTAFTPKERDIIGIESLQDITNFTPGFSYSTSLDRAFIRGVGRQTNNLSSQPGVATYNDGVYNSSVVAAAGDSLFVAQTEVLRGPQGTLYGRNSIGGTINSVSRRPTKDFYAEGRVTLGNYGVNNYEVAMSDSLTDNVRFRVAASDANQNKGYYQNLAGLTSEGGKGSSFYVEGQLEANVGPVDLWGKVGGFGYSATYRSGTSNAPYDTAQFPIGTLGPGAGFVYNPCFLVATSTACAASPTGFGIGGTFTQLGNTMQNPGINNPRQFNANTSEQANLTDDYNFAGTATWHTPWSADLKYIGGYTHYHYHLTTDFDGTPVISYNIPTFFQAAPGTPIVPLGGTAHLFPSSPFVYVEDKTYFSNEVDFTSTGNAPFQWIVGLYQYHEQFTQPVDFFDPQQTQLLLPINFQGFAPIPNPTANFYHINQQMQADSLAGFGQADWKITDTVKLTGGIRYSNDWEGGVESTRQVTYGLPAFYAAFGLGNTPLGPIGLLGDKTPAIDATAFLISKAIDPGVKAAPTFDSTTGLWSRPLSASWSAVTGTGGVEWTPTDDALYYFKYSRGYKAGGFNTGTISSFPETQPEFLDDFEGGAKNQWFDRTLQTNIAIFYYDYSNMQIPLSVQPSTGPATTQFFNMKQVIAYGVELETVWQPIENAQILFNYSYLNATIHDPTDCFTDGDDPFALLPGDQTAACKAGSGAQTVNGQTVPESPKNRITLNGNYTFKFDPGSLTLSATYIWKDQTYDSIFNRSYSLAPAYDQVDLRATWRDSKDRFTLIAYGKNVFNSLGYDGVAGIRQSNQAIGTFQGFGFTPPATYGVELQVRFR